MMLEFQSTSKDPHCDNVPLIVYRGGGIDRNPARQDVLFDASMLMTSETVPVPTPFASSRDATNFVPAGNGRKVMAAPVTVLEFQSEFGISIERGVALKGTTVKVKGRDAGGLPPEKRTVKLPHCCTGENEIESKSQRAASGPKLKTTTVKRNETDNIAPA